jgi:hypothetical protein
MLRLCVNVWLAVGGSTGIEPGPDLKARASDAAIVCVHQHVIYVELRGAGLPEDGVSMEVIASIKGQGDTRVAIASSEPELLKV